MRVLVLTNMYPTPAKPWWGTFVAEQVEDVRRLGVEVDVLAFDATDDRREYLRAARRYRHALRGHDVVHAHYGLAGAIAVTQRRVPVVTTFHGGDYSGLVPWHTWVSRLVARRSLPIVVTSDGGRRLWAPGAVVLPVGVNTELFVPTDRAVARRALGLAEDGRYAVLLGRRDDPAKRADLFDAAIEAARRHDPELSPLSLERVGRTEVARYLNAADVAVLTSDREGFPVAVREALAVETPVVSVAAGAVPQLIAGLEGCAIVPRDPASIGEAILAAVGIPRAAAWRARAEETSGPTIAAQLVQIYADVSARAGSRRSPAGV